MGGSPGGQISECFSRNLRPSSESLTSWCSSNSVGGPFRRVFGLTDTPGLGGLLLLSEVGLSLLVPAGGIFNCRRRVVSSELVGNIWNFGF